MTHRAEFPPDSGHKYDGLDPDDQAQALVDSCHGDLQEALAMAHTNVDFASRDVDRDYWGRVAIALQQRITRSHFSSAASNSASPLGTDMGLSIRGNSIASQCTPADKPLSGQNCSLVPAVFMDDFGEILRITLADPAEMEQANQLLRVCGSGRRWAFLVNQA